MKQILIGVVVFSGLLVPCRASTIPYDFAEIVYCLNSFATGPCTTVASSSGAAITRLGTVDTTGESITYAAKSVSMPGALGGSVVVTSNTLNSSGPGVMVDALEQMVDSVTVSADPFNGSLGYMVLNYTLHGTNNATGTGAGATFGSHGVPYACVKVGINDPVFPFGCTAYDQPSVDGTFTEIFPFTYGVPFPLWFQLESIAGTGFGPGRPIGPGTSMANFYDTATIAGFVLYDGNMNPINVTPDISSALGVSYQNLSPVPEPSTLMLLSAGLAGIVLARRFNYKIRP